MCLPLPCRGCCLCVCMYSSCMWGSCARPPGGGEGAREVEGEEEVDGEERYRSSVGELVTHKGGSTSSGKRAVSTRSTGTAGVGVVAAAAEGWGGVWAWSARGGAGG